MDEAKNHNVLRVKRYANRKLYVPECKSYTNFRGLYEAILGGRDVRVSCVATGRDVSVNVLGMVYQVMVVESGAVPSSVIHNRIRRDKAALLTAS